MVVFLEYCLKSNIFTQFSHPSEQHSQNPSQYSLVALQPPHIQHIIIAVISMGVQATIGMTVASTTTFVSAVELRGQCSWVHSLRLIRLLPSSRLPFSTSSAERNENYTVCMCIF